MKPPFYGIPTLVPEIDFLYDGDQELRGMWGQPPSAVRSSEARQVSSSRDLCRKTFALCRVLRGFWQALGGDGVKLARIAQLGKPPCPETDDDQRTDAT